MHLNLSGSRLGRRTAAATALLATTIGILIAAPDGAGVTPKPPPNPTDSQINAAQDAKTALATKVGALSGQIAQARIELQQLQAKAELAEQKVAYAISQLQAANAAADRAKAAVKTAQKDVERAHDRFVTYVQASYMDGTIDGTGGALLTAADPSALLEQSALEQYQQQHQADAVGALQQATVEKSNADAKARLAVQNSKLAKERAESQKQAAYAAVTAANARRAALQTSMAATEHELDTAREQLATLNNQRAAYLAYKAEQARLARERARRERLARERAARLARERAAQSGGGGGGGSIFTPGPPPPSGGSWTATKGRKAADRALSQLGMPYAWAGGNQYGPTQGVCDASNGAPNDCYVVGFDCSGLAMYAWGQGWAHYAATQYLQAGRYHPGANDLRRGDLIFWSSNGRISGIHHVAIYIGNGQIVEAPYSGGYVQTASVYEYGGFFGATRPLT